MANQFTDVVWPGWEVVRKLGEGSFGGVYEIQRTLPDGQVEKGALKKLTLPRDADEIEELRSNQFDDASITAHFSNQLKSLVSEYGMMKKLSGCPNIVHSLDLRYIQHDDGIGWDLYIRMELLTPLKKVLQPEYDEQTVLNLGKNLCAALIACEKEHIIHRDIKPENILVSDGGIYKLGDFGVAKVAVENGTGTITGTTGYMAPEISKHEAYGPTVDIYSLGMVLYWMMNERTLPFLPLPPQIPTAMQRQEATNRRFRGEALPAPKNGSEALKQVILKACAYDPEDRYQTAAEMLEALEEDCGEENTVYEQPKPIRAERAAEKPTEKPRQPEQPQEVKASAPRKPENQTEKKPEKKGAKKLILPIAAATLCVVAAVALLGRPKKTTNQPTATKPATSATAAAETVAARTEETPILKLTLTLQEDAPLADVRHDGPLVQGRIRALSPTAVITQDEDTGVIEAVIPLADVGQVDLETVVQCTINRPQKLHFVKYISSFQYYADDTEGVVAREDIVEARAVTAGEMQAQYGMPEDVVAANGDTLTLDEEMPCLYLKLTENGANQLHALDEIDGEPTMGLDIAVSGGTTFDYLFAAPDGESFVLALGDAATNNIAESLAYGLTHEMLNRAYSYDYSVEPEAIWETEATADFYGAQQCDDTALPDPENTVSVRLEINDRASDEEVNETIRVIKDKMDIIGLPYAFGRDPQLENSVIIRTSPERLNAKLLDFVTRAYGATFSTSCGLYPSGLQVLNTKVVPVGDSGAIGLMVQFTKPEALEEFSAKLRWKDDKSLWIGLSQDPMLSTQITTTITDNTIVLDSLPMLSQDTIGEEYRYILELFAYCLKQKSVGASVYLSSYSFASDQSYFGLTNVTEEDQKLLDIIQEAYPETDSWIEEDRQKTLKIFLHAKPGPDFVDTCFDQVEDIFEKCDLDNSGMDSVTVYLVDEKSGQRCRLVFTKYSSTPYLRCIGRCSGEYLDEYAEEFSDHASWRLFFQKRSFQMYGT